LEQQLGHSIAREFELRGEASFRAAEERLVCELLAGAGELDVLALGGGSVLSAGVREALRGHVTVLLEVDTDLAWARVHGAPPATRLLWARTRSGEYPVFVGRGLLAAEPLRALTPLPASSRAFCVSDETVAGLYAERLGELAATLAIAPGEPSKTLRSAELVWQELAAQGM